MPRISRRRTAVQDEDEDVEVSQPHEVLSEGYEDEDDGVVAERDQMEELARKLVRYAMSCEYGRRPIKRQDINQKILGASSRQFPKVFHEAQLMLRETFGMQLVELPRQEKLTPAQRRAAASKSDKPVSTSTGNYILQSTLDSKYRTADIIPPPRVPTVFEESSYIGIYTFLITTIYVSGGSIPEELFYRHLRRVNADKNTPIDGTEKLIQRMVGDGYLTKIKDNSAGEELVEYHVGPRGKLEVGKDGVAQMVRTVYGDAADDDLLKRLERTLALNFQRSDVEVETDASAAPRKRKRPCRGQQAASDNGEAESLDEDDEESEDD